MALKKTPSGKYKIQFQYQGKTYIKTVGPKKSEAVAYEAKWLEDLRKADLFGDIKIITLAESLQAYIDKRQHLRSIKNIESGAKRIIEYFGKDIKLHKLTTEQVWDFDANLKSLGMTSATRNFYFTLINSAMKESQKLGYKGVILDKPKLPAFNKRTEIFTEEQEQQLYELLDPKNHKIEKNKKDVFLTQSLVKLLFQFGCRYNEMLSLTWDSVDFASKTILLNRTKVNNKSILAMTNTAYEVLKNMFDTPGRHPIYLFPHQNNNGPRVHPSPAVLKAIKKIPGAEHLTVHSIRHTVLSRLVINGLSLYETSKIAGHASITTTTRYAHLDMAETNQKTVDILNRY